MRDTTLGGRGRDFPTTRLGNDPRPFEDSDPAFRKHFETLVLSYWKPVYRYARVVWAKSNEDAKDLTQAFFLWLFEGRALPKYDAARGSFRRYLKFLLRRFLSHRQEAVRRLKRGGAAIPLSLEAGGLGREITCAEEDPEETFDREWLNVVAQRAIRRIRERLAQQGRSAAFRVFETYDLSPAGGSATYREVAAKLGLSESSVRNHLFAVREELRQEIRREIRGTTGSEEESGREWHELLGGV